jgi:hypothetical protein
MIVNGDDAMNRLKHRHPACVRHVWHCDNSHFNSSRIRPDRELHDTIVDVEPHTGNTMRARQRLQMNIAYVAVAGWLWLGGSGWVAVAGWL